MKNNGQIKLIKNADNICRQMRMSDQCPKIETAYRGIKQWCDQKVLDISAQKH